MIPGGSTAHKVIIELEYLEKIKGLKNTLSKLNELRNSGLMNQKSFDKLEKTIDSLSGGLVKSVKKYDKYQKQLKQSKKQTIELKTSTDKFVESLSSFSVTLPLLFGFQQFSQGIQSMIDPALQLMGVTELYNEFLALKYLPTAEEQLENVLELGEAWLSESEAQRKAEGDLMLAAKQMSDLVVYTAQMAQIFAAVGEAIPFLGRNMGAAAGAALGLGSAVSLLTDDTGRTIAQFSGFEAALSQAVAGGMSDFLHKTGLIGDDLDKTEQSAEEAKEEVDNLVKSLEGIPSKVQTDIIMNIVTSGNKEATDYLFENLKKEGKEISPMDLVPRGNIEEELGKSTKYGEYKYNIPTLTKDEIEEGYKYGSITPTSKVKQFVEGFFGTKWGQFISLPSAISSIPLFDEGGVVPGPVGAPVPILAHGGETVLPTHSEKSISGGITFNVTYNVTVADKREFEMMLRDNNETLKREVSRSIGNF